MSAPVSSPDTFGSPFERVFVAILAIVTALILIQLAVEGPMLLHRITYKTADVINNQLVGQDIANVFLLSPILLAAGITLLMKKPAARYLLMLTPLYLIYYVLSYTIGWEWSSPQYVGNSVSYTFHFLFVLIASLIMLLYSIAIFPRHVEVRFRKPGLIAYSVLFSLFLLVFASMWVREVVEVMETGTARAYDIAPTAFWVVRIFDLGFSIPLGLISIYLLWARPTTTFQIQFLFYGFFFTMIIAVNAMGIMMLVNNDPTFLWRDMLVFLVLALIVFTGFVYILKSYKTKA